MKLTRLCTLEWGNPLHRRSITIQQAKLQRRLTWLTANIQCVWSLVDSNIVNMHLRWELDHIQVYISKVERHSQVREQILQHLNKIRCTGEYTVKAYHRLLRNGSCTNLSLRIGSSTSGIKRPDRLIVVNPCNEGIVVTRLVFESVNSKTACVLLITIWV